MGIPSRNNYPEDSDENPADAYFPTIGVNPQAGGNPVDEINRLATQGMSKWGKKFTETMALMVAVIVGGMVAMIAVSLLGLILFKIWMAY